MTDRTRKERQRRLERAGYVAIKGWVPAAFAERVAQQVEMHRENVEMAADGPPKPRGRPRTPAP